MSRDDLMSMLGVHTYDLLYRDISSIGDGEPSRSSVEWHDARTVDTALIEASRPGYRTMSNAYLEEGHHGIIGMIDGAVVAMTWMIHNPGPRRIRVKRYFPLDPGHVFLHGSWTHPDARGRGIQSAGIVQRLNCAKDLPGATHLVANFNRTATVSRRNFEKYEFTAAGQLVVIGRGPIQIPIVLGRS